MNKIFITRRISSIACELLKNYFIVHENSENKPLSKDKLKEVVLQYDGVLSSVSEKFTSEILNEAKIKVISNYAAGLDNIDLSFAKEKGISVYNTPDIVTNSTADMTFALLLSLTRKIQSAHSYIKGGLWTGWDPEIFLGEELNDKTFGIIGMGRIGKAAAQRAEGFGMNVIFFDTNLNLISKYKRVELDFLLQEADYISIHVPLIKETINFIDREKIKKMNKKPILLNLSRGGVVETNALIEALKNGQIRGACLDVTQPEPISAEHPLCLLDNCIITPHIGTATKECRNNMAKLAAENIINYFKTKE